MPISRIARLVRGLVFTGALLAPLTAQAAQSRLDRVTLPNGKSLFLSGMNLAWISYAADVGNSPMDTTAFKYAIQDLRDSGGNVMRVWLSTNGANDPVYDSATGLVKGLGKSTIQNVKWMLEICRRNGVLLMPVLMSHNFTESPTAQVGLPLEFNRKLLTTDGGIKAYLDNAVVPLVKAIGRDTALACWEVFNEPEGMVENIGWTAGARIRMSDVQKVVNRVAGAIHRAVPGVLVSNGAQTMATSSVVPADGNLNHYSDSALKLVGGDTDGTLDFYMVHYYPWNGAKYSPFRKPASYWGLDKPLVIAEFPAGSWSIAANSNKPNGFHALYDDEKIDTLYQNLYGRGYAGALSWCYFGDTWDTWLGDFSTTAPHMKRLYDAHATDIRILDVVRSVRSGNGVLQLSYTNADNSIWTSIKKDSAMDLSAFKKVSVKVLSSRSSKGTFKIHWVLKTGSAWRWDVSDTYCTPAADSTWSVCEADLAKMHFHSDPSALADLGAVKSLILQFGTDNSFDGKVWLDSVKFDSRVVYTFDNGKPGFGVDTYSPVEAAKLTGMEVVFLGEATTAVRRAAVPGCNVLAVVRTSKGIRWTLAAGLPRGGEIRFVRPDGRDAGRVRVMPGVRSGVWSHELPAETLVAVETQTGASALVSVP